MLCSLLLFSLWGHTADLFKSEVISKPGLFNKGIEGPTTDLAGNVYAVNFSKLGTIGIMKPGQQPELWLELPKGSIGNALHMSPAGDLLVADRSKHQILKIDLKTKVISTLASHSEMNQPNDLTIAKNGDIYLSDPSWSSKHDGKIWLLDQNKKFSILASHLKAVNGIDLSPDESKLYFTESISGGLYVFDLKDHKLTNKRLLYQFKKDTVDGIKVDAAGTIYVVRIGEGKVDRISAEGKLLTTISLKGKEPTNLTFGGSDGKTLFVTLRDQGTLESFQVPEPGREWKNPTSQNSGVSP